MRKSLWIILLFAVLTARPGFSQLRTDTPKNLFLAPVNTGEISTSVKPSPDHGVLEKQKIVYLLQRIAHSDMIFIRNEKEHSAKEAAKHLRMKYGFSQGRIQTAKQFIDMIASRSLSSGEVYRIKTRDGISYPVRDILYNELDFLEKSINT